MHLCPLLEVYYEVVVGKAPTILEVASWHPTLCRDTVKLIY